MGHCLHLYFPLRRLTSSFTWIMFTNHKGASTLELKQRDLVIFLGSTGAVSKRAIMDNIRSLMLCAIFQEILSSRGILNRSPPLWNNQTRGILPCSKLPSFFLDHPRVPGASHKQITTATDEDDDVELRKTVEWVKWQRRPSQEMN